MSEVEQITTTWVNGKLYGIVTPQPMQLVSYDKEPCYRGVTSAGQVLYVLEDVLEANRDTFTEAELFDADFWLDSVDAENCWIAARCEACGVEYRPCDGYYEPGEYSYCAECCHW